MGLEVQIGVQVVEELLPVEFTEWRGRTGTEEKPNTGVILCKVGSFRRILWGRLRVRLNFGRGSWGFIILH